MSTIIKTYGNMLLSSLGNTLLLTLLALIFAMIIGLIFALMNVGKNRIFNFIGTRLLIKFNGENMETILEASKKQEESQNLLTRFLIP